MNEGGRMRRETGVVILSMAVCGLSASALSQPADVEFASTHVYAQVLEGVEPGLLADGRITFSYVAENDLPEDVLADIEFLLAIALEIWSVESVEPLLQFEPSNQALAREIGIDRLYRINVPASTANAAMVALLGVFSTHLETVSLVSYGELLAVPPPLPSDPKVVDQWGLHNIGQIIDFQGVPPNLDGCPGAPPGVDDADIDAPEAWELEQGSSDIIVAVLDAGADLDHPDLVNNLVPGRNFRAGEDPTDPSDSVLFGHGTMVSGIVAAQTDNAVGVAGMSWNSKIMPLRMAEFGPAIDGGEALQALVWATDNGADIINMSWIVFFQPDIDLVAMGIKYAHQSGLLLVGGVGNQGNELHVQYPASDPRVIAVGGTTAHDLLWCGSHTDTNMDAVLDVSVVAPCKNVVSTHNDAVTGAPQFCPNQLYCSSTGTSFAAPHVAGLGALIWSVNPGLSRDDVRTIIESEADDLGAPGPDPQYGNGRINAYRAVCTARSMTSCPADLDEDNVVGIMDFLDLLAGWGCPGPADFVDCNHDTGINEFLALLAAWGPCPQSGAPDPPTVEEELADACLTEDDWDDYVDVMTDEAGSQADKDRYDCWMRHYIIDCSKCQCPHTGTGSGCPNPDPFQ